MNGENYNTNKYIEKRNYNQFSIKIDDVKNLNNHIRFMAEDNIRNMNDV